MIKKSIFVMLAMFGLNSVASNNETTEVDHMSDMMHSSGEGESNFAGSVELKYKAPLGEEEEGVTSYRVRLGWKGAVNEVINWGAGVSSNVEQHFGSPSLKPLNLEHYYASYTPVEGFSIKVGKHAWTPKFHKTGVLYDDDIYKEGVYAKYRQGDDDGKVYVKLGAYMVDAVWQGPWSEDATIVKGKVGGKYPLSSDVSGGAYVSAQYDVTGEGATLAQVGVNLKASVGVPVGGFAAYVTDAKNLETNHSYTGGVYVGNAGTPTSGEMRDYGFAVSYYSIHGSDYNTALLDTDYVSSAGANESGARGISADSKAEGVAVRAQYNLWDGVNAVAKYAHDLGAEGTNAHNLVGEVTVNF